MNNLYRNFDFAKRFTSSIHSWIVEAELALHSKNSLENHQKPGKIFDFKNDESFSSSASNLTHALLRMAERGTRAYEKPDFNIDSIEIKGKETFVTIEAVDERPFCRLLHFRREIAPKLPKLLIVAPLSGHFASLLRDTVQTALQSCDVYMTDWVSARDVPLEKGKFDLDDYIAYIKSYIEILGPDLHVLAVCQPVVPVIAAIALLASEGSHFQPRSAIMMGGPADTSASSSPVTRFAEQHPYEWLESVMISEVPDGYAGRGRKVCPGFLMLSGFIAMHPGRHYKAYVQYMYDLLAAKVSAVQHHEKFYDEYLSVMDLPAEYFLQTLKVVFQERHLPAGLMVWQGRPVDLTAIKQTGLMTIEGEMDDISPPGETEALQRLCVNIPQEKRAHYLQAGVGHYGVFSGHVWREQIFPRIAQFIQLNAQEVPA